MTKRKTEEFFELLAPKEPPKYVGKYQRWDDPKCKAALVQGYIYIADPNTWDDKNDCRLVIRLGNYRDEVVKNFLDSIPSHDLQRIKRGLENLSIEELEIIAADNFRQTHMSKWGIFCTSRSIDDPECWQKFSNGKYDKAYCLILDYEEMNNLKFAPVEVIYKEKLAEFSFKDGISNDERLAVVFSQKLKTYQWENEIRFILAAPQEQLAPENPIYFGSRMVKIPPECIKMIQVHSDSGLESEIKNALMETRFQNIPIVRNP